MTYEQSEFYVFRKKVFEACTDPDPDSIDWLGEYLDELDAPLHSDLGRNFLEYRVKKCISQLDAHRIRRVVHEATLDNEAARELGRPLLALFGLEMPDQPPQSA